MLQSNETLDTPAAVETQLRETIQAATGRVMLALPAERYPDLAPALLGAVDDGVVVALLTYGGTPEAGPPVRRATTLYRSWDVTGGLTVLSTDRRDGFVAIRQQFVYPRTSPTYGVTQLVVRHDSGLGPESSTDGDAQVPVDERLTIGGLDTDYCRSVPDRPHDGVRSPGKTATINRMIRIIVTIYR